MEHGGRCVSYDGDITMVVLTVESCRLFREVTGSVPVQWSVR